MASRKETSTAWVVTPLGVVTPQGHVVITTHQNGFPKGDRYHVGRDPSLGVVTPPAAPLRKAVSFSIRFECSFFLRLPSLSAVSALMWYHVVPGTYYSQGLDDGQVLTSMRNVGELQVHLEQRGRFSKRSPAVVALSID